MEVIEKLREKIPAIKRRSTEFMLIVNNRELLREINSEEAQLVLGDLPMIDGAYFSPENNFEELALRVFKPIIEFKKT